MKKDVYNLTNSQKSILYTEEVYKGTSVNNICTSGIIYEDIDESLLKEAIKYVVKQNDSFRIHIIFQDNTVKQYFSEYEDFEIETQYIKTESELKKVEEEQSRIKFEIIDSDLFKFKIVILKNKFACVILTANHIISDSWSMGLTIQQILKNYHALRNNETIDIESQSYIDYISSENEYKKSEKYEKDKQYWNNVFSSLPERASIPGSLAQLNNTSIEASRTDFSIDLNTVNSINNYCKENHISAFNFFMAIYSLYISRVSYSQDFIIGTPILNRTSFKDKHTTGMFINTVPVRVKTFANTEFKSFASSFAKQTREILRHQKYSYNSILEDIRLSHKNIPSLYNVMISYQITKAFDKEFGNYKTNWTFNGCSTNDIDIHIYDINDTGKLIISYDYLICKYSLKDIQNMHERVIYMINQVLNNPKILTDKIEIITTDEKHRIIYDFNTTAASYPKDKTLSQLFEEQVEKTPDNIAIVFEDKQMTYRELNEKANSLANYLRTKENILSNDLVGIMVNRSLEMIIAILAVLKSGGAYIPIDPTYPKSRISYMLESSCAKLLLTQEHLLNTIDYKNKIAIDLKNSSLYSDSINNLNTINTPQDLAYVIFTSGSTGNPKGVMLKHNNIVNFIYGMKSEFKFSSSDSIASITTISFDIFVFESLMPLLNGLKVVIANEQEQSNVRLFNNLCIKNNVNIIQTTPSRMQAFMSDASSLAFIKNASHILVGGEPFPAFLLGNIKKISNTKIYNMYGPTETAVWSSLKELTNSDLITIGRPIINTQMYILDSHLQPVPFGTVADIYISGDGVSKGYLNNPELTKATFVPNVFINNSIMYKTGDLGMYTANGEIICFGRSDSQVKLRGLRIELSEIESKINELPSIYSCAVVKKSDHNSHEFLCAYYTANKAIKVEEIRKYLEAFLPKYMIPTYFTQMESLPYTPNGKLDRKKLPEPQYQQIKKEIVLPRNDIDSKLVELFQNLLDISNVSVDDNFFNIGGDSLTAINLCVQIQNVFNVQLFVRDIYEHPVLQELSDIIFESSKNINSDTIEPVSEAEFYAVSSAQKRMYFSSHVAGNNSINYNIPGCLIFEGNVDASKLQNCFNKLINRHEALRTSFQMQNENVVQHISKHIKFELKTLDNASFNDLDVLFNSFIKPFDLSIAPLFDAILVNFTNNKSALFVNMHHIISDGESLAILTDELCKLYNGETLSELKITYKDFSNFENKQLSSGKLKESEDYWVSQFKDEIPVLNLPTTYSRPAIQTFEGKKIYSSIDIEEVSQIKELCKSLNITPYMFLLGCFFILLSKYTSQNDIVVGSPIIGRQMADTLNVIGMFVNTLALKNHVDAEILFKDYILKVKQILLEAYKYQTYPFDELVHKLNIKRDTSRSPLFDTMFTYQNNEYKKLNFNGIKANYYIPDTHISKFDLSLEAIPSDNEIKLVFEYATSLFDEEFITNMANHYENIIKAVLKNNCIKISDIDMITENEKNQILNIFNNTAANFPKDKTVAELFEAQVSKTPDAIAVEDYNGNQLTFIEFNKKANQLARLLRNKGIGRNDLVCIITKRSLDMMIGIWGIIKAGAAYVPIDPNYPEERKEFILKDSSPKVVLLSDTDIETSIEKIDLSKKDYEKEDDSNLELINTPEDAVYCIYTSGTTGRPKGVINKHVGLINRIMWMNSKYPIKEGDVILQKTTYCFDVSVWEIVWWSFVGAKVSLLKVDGEKNPKDIIDAIKKNKITTIHFVPSMLNIFLIYIEKLETLEDKLDTLKYVFTSGEELKKNQVEIFNKKIKSVNNTVKLINVYGPTEASIDVTYYECKEQNELIPIGKPISNIQMYILNGMNLCSIGILGEICIGGIGVAKGYLNREELNKEKFIDNPFAEGKIYRTGDLGRWLEDGNIEYVGRIDHQVKIRGQRIELGEIENLMLKYPHIKNVVVIKQTIQNRDFLSGYFVADKRINTNELRKSLTKSLPNYMVPTYFIPLDDMPYNSNGKLDRKKLPLPNEILDISNENYVAPKTKLQNQLVNIWEKVLNTKPIGINDNFFALGGDSLLAMNLSVELLQISNKISYSDIFRYPTIAELEYKIASNIEDPLFSKIESLSESYETILKNNKNTERITNWHPKSVLLTGATGFLGIHILDELLRNEKCNIYCIIREETGLTSRAKLHQKLNYYFGNKYNEMIDKRIFAVTGDITKSGFGLPQDSLIELANSVDLVINCAANVSHYGKYSSFYESNVTSVKNTVDFCSSFNIKLYHISTISITGLKLDSSYLSNKKRRWFIREENNKVIFDESSLYVGQIIENVYERSKFEAECLILDAINNGADAYILRMGNLMPRYKDGVFQENIGDNAFINRLIAFAKLGVCPNYLLSEKLEFTPVDEAARAIYKLVTHPSNTNRIFHLYNSNYVPIKKLLKIFKSLGCDIDIVPENEFTDKVNLLIKDSTYNNMLNILISDFDNYLHLNYKNDIIIKSKFSIKYLYKTLFKWPKISKKYLIRLVNLIKKEL